MATSHTDSSNSHEREVDGWVMVEKPHTKDRKPQYNGDNESQNELASSSSDAADVPDYKPGSHDETETDDSIDTVPDTDVTQKTVTFGLEGPWLTKNAVDLSGRQVGGYTRGVDWWLSDAGASFPPFEPRDDSSMGDTTMASTRLGSAVSIVSSDEAAPIYSSSSDLREIGSWVTR